MPLVTPCQRPSPSSGASGVQVVTSTPPSEAPGLDKTLWVLSAARNRCLDVRRTVTNHPAPPVEGFDVRRHHRSHRAAVSGQELAVGRYDLAAGARQHTRHARARLDEAPSAGPG